MLKYDLEYLGCVNNECAYSVIQNKKSATSYIKVICRQLLLVVLCLNIFSVLCLDDSLFSAGVFANTLPQEQNFGKLKFVSNGENEEYLPTGFSFVDQLIYPFDNCYYDAKNDCFIGFGNGLVCAIIDGTIGEIGNDNGLRSLLLVSSSGLEVEYVGVNFIGVKEGEVIKQNDKIAWCDACKILVNVSLMGEKIENEALFAYK